MELSDYLQGGDILDFINQYLEDLDNKEREENRPKMDFKTAAKLTSMSCGLKRTMSDKAKSGITTSDHKGVARSKSLKSKTNSTRRPEETRSRSRLDSGIGDDSVFSESGFKSRAGYNGGCTVDTHKRRTKSSSALNSSGGRSRLSSVNDNPFLENGEKSPSLGDGSNVFE